MKRAIWLLIGLLVLVAASGAVAENYVVPEGTLVIEAEAFAGTGLRPAYYGEDEDGMEPIWYSVRLPEGIRRIEARAFANSGLWEINLPDSLEYIAPDAFDGCEDVRATVNLGSYAQSYCEANDAIRYDANLPADTTVIGKEQYAGIAIKNLVLPEGVTRIESRAFADGAFTTLNLPDSLTYIAPDAFDGVKAYNDSGEPLIALEVFPDSLGAAYCKEHGLPSLTKLEPNVYIVEREFNPLTSLMITPGLTRDGYTGLVLYQWSIADDYDGVDGYKVDSVEVSAEAAPYITAGRSQERTDDCYIRIACSDDVAPLGDGIYDKMTLPGALTVSYTYRGQSLSRTVDIVICNKLTRTSFKEEDWDAVVGVPVTYTVEAWTSDEYGQELERIESFTPHWAVNGVPVTDDGEVSIDGRQIARFEFGEGGYTATVTWLVANEDGYELTCADDNGGSAYTATMYPEVHAE